MKQVNAPTQLPPEVDDADPDTTQNATDNMTNPMLNITQGSTGEVTCEGDAGGAVM